MSDVAVVGAGITGLAVAHFLAERGVDTVVLERAGVAAGASGVQPGGVRQQWGTRVNCLLARESLAFYRELDVGARFDPCGYLFVAHGEEMLAELRANVALQNELGIGSRILGPAEVEGIVPGLDVLGAAWHDEDGYFDRPQTVVESFAARARLEIADVRGLRPDGGAWRIETSTGALTAGAVVVAAGWETPAVAGLDLPIEAEQRRLYLSDPIRERLLEPLVVATERRVAAKQLGNGRVLAGDLGAPDWRARIADLLPILAYVTYPVVVDGVYDVTPDRQPIVGEVAPGLWAAAGFSGHGFMLAPAIARRLAAAVVGERIDDLLDPFDLGRFARGELEPERRVV